MQDIWNIIETNHSEPALIPGQTPSEVHEPVAPVIESDPQTPVEPEGQPEPVTFLSEEFRPPESFQNEKEESEWYRQKYMEIHGRISKKEFYDEVFEKYKDSIIAQEEEASKIVETYKAIKANPREYVRQYFPETLAEIGVSPVMNDDEISAKVDEQLKSEFGADYANLYNPSDLAPFKGNTITRQIQSRGDDLYKQIHQDNEKNRKIFEDYTSKVAAGNAPVDEAQIQAVIDADYDDFRQTYKDVSRQDYDAFLQELKSSNWIPTGKDLWKMRNVDAMVEKARQEGIAEGKASIKKNIERASTPKIETPNTPAPSGSKPYKSYEQRQIEKGNLLFNY